MKDFRTCLMIFLVLSVISVNCSAHSKASVRSFSEIFDLSNFYVEEEMILNIMKLSTHQVVDLTGNIYWRTLGLYDKKKVYERVRTHIYKSLKYESEHGTDIDLPEQSIDSAMPEILQSFKNTYLEESAVQIQQKYLNVLEHLSKEVEDLKEEIMNLRALLSA